MVLPMGTSRVARIDPQAASDPARAATLCAVGRDPQRVSPPYWKASPPTGEARAAVGCVLGTIQRIAHGPDQQCSCARRIAGPRTTMQATRY